MQQFRKILVGLDLSCGDRLAAAELTPTTRVVIARAMWLAEQNNASLTFMSALEISAHARELLEQDAESDNVLKAAENDLAKVVQQAKERGIEAESKVMFGRAWEELIRQVLRGEHDLLIAGTRNRGGAERLLFGSTGMKLLRKCPCPVWITRPDPVPEDLNILVASDLSEVSVDALSIAVSTAQITGAKLHVVHAFECTDEQSERRVGTSDEETLANHNKLREEAKAELNQQLSQTDYRTLTYGAQVHVTDGPADVVLLEAIEQYGIDLLVMGTVARSGIPGLLIGNTAERLLTQVPCSVLAIKPHGFESPVTLE